MLLKLAIIIVLTPYDLYMYIYNIIHNLCTFIIIYVCRRWKTRALPEAVLFNNKKKIYIYIYIYMPFEVFPYL